MEESVSRWEPSSSVSSEQRLNKRAALTTRCQARAAASRLEAPAELSDANKIACEDNGDAAAVQYCSFKDPLSSLAFATVEACKDCDHLRRACESTAPAGSAGDLLRVRT